MKRNILDYFGVMCAKTFSAGLNIFHTIKIIRNAPLAQLDRAAMVKGISQEPSKLLF